MVSTDILQLLVATVVPLGVGAIWILIKKGARAETEALQSAVLEIKADLREHQSQSRSDMLEMKNLVYGVKQTVDALVSDGKRYSFQLQQQSTQQARLEERIRDLEMVVWSSGKPPRRPITGKHAVTTPPDEGDEDEG